MIKLWGDEIPGYDNKFPVDVPGIEPYIVNSKEKHGAIIVCPGGGYAMKAAHEGEPIALWLNSIGISAFVLNYRVHPYKHPYPLMDAKRAIRYIRYHASQWNIDAEKIGILGFSAGGHLASTAGTHFDRGDKSSPDPIEQVSSRPDTLILCYPVITFSEFGHQGSKNNLLGENPDKDLIQSLSTHQAVTEHTPPTFLWHTANDAGVPVENSLLFAGALSCCKVPFELHVFKEGAHGLGLAEDKPDVAVWTDLCGNWLRSIRFMSATSI